LTQYNKRYLEKVKAVSVLRCYRRHKNNRPTIRQASVGRLFNPKNIIKTDCFIIFFL